jgi:phosphoribosylanthranilate isomerase
MRVKICGVTKVEQGRAIADLGATALGFMCVPQSPRYVVPEQIEAIVAQLPAHAETGQQIDRVGVFVNAPLREIAQVVAIAKLNAVQLHGSESPQFCQELRAFLPGIEIIKALRIRDAATLEQAQMYQDWVDALLLDAYNPHAHHPGLFGGTGKTLDWANLQQFRVTCSWFLAGGITPDNVLSALSQVQPNGIDLSSGVELTPGDKDLQKVARLFEQLGKIENYLKQR